MPHTNDLTWNNAIKTPVGWNEQTAMNSYLGLQPNMQTKSPYFGKYMSYKPAYITGGDMDFQLPLKSATADNTARSNPRYEFDQFSLSAENLSSHDIAKYKDMLNPNGAKQVAFKANELYGYKEELIK